MIRIVLAALLAALALGLAPAFVGPLIVPDDPSTSRWVAAAQWAIAFSLLALACALLWSKEERAARLAGSIGRALLALVSLAVSLFFVEGALRVLRPNPEQIRVESHEFAYTAQLNRYGFRGTDFERDKADGVWRVLVIGDSFIYGTGVDDTDRIPARLQEALAPHTERRVEVIGLAMPAIDTYEYLGMAERFRDLDPDLVILSLYVDNDIEKDAPSRLRRFFKSWEINRRISSWVSKRSRDRCQYPAEMEPRYQELFCVGLLNPGLVSRAAVASDDHAYYEELVERFESLPYTGENILAVRALFPESAFLLVVLPSKYQVSAAYFPELERIGFRFARDEPVSRGLQDAILRWAIENEIATVDVLPALRSQTNLRHYHAIDDHFNATGNRSTVEELRRSIVSRRQLPTIAPPAER